MGPSWKKHTGYSVPRGAMEWQGKLPAGVVRRYYFEGTITEYHTYPKPSAEAVNAQIEKNTAAHMVWVQSGDQTRKVSPQDRLTSCPEAVCACCLQAITPGDCRFGNVLRGGLCTDCQAYIRGSSVGVCINRRPTLEEMQRLSESALSPDAQVLLRLIRERDSQECPAAEADRKPCSSEEPDA